MRRQRLRPGDSVSVVASPRLARAAAVALAAGGALVLLGVQGACGRDAGAVPAVAPAAGVAAAVAWAFVAGRADKLRPGHVRAIAVAAVVVALSATASVAESAGAFTAAAALALAIPIAGAFGAAVAAALHGLPASRLGPSLVAHALVLAAGCALVLLAQAWIAPVTSAWLGLGLALAGAGRAIVRPVATPSPAAVAAGERLLVPPGHFYSPVPDREQVLADAGRLFGSGLRELPGIDLGLERQLALVRELAVYRGTEDFAAEPRVSSRYCLANEFFCYGDAFAFHALLRHVRPRRVVEIGSGWSSAVLLDTNERHFANSIECTFVDPYPDRLFGRLRPGDRERVRVCVQRVQDVPLAVFSTLASGDMLFIDSSHVCKTGSDVHHLLFEILPRLANGVWVHVHDVFANFEYPPEWVYEGRAWNESYVLRALLQDNRAWRIELHAATLAAAGAAEFARMVPEWAANVGGSIWLRRV